MMHLDRPNSNLAEQSLPTQKPLVSIAMPTYNRPEYLRQAIQGAVSQSYSNLEILVGDNGNSSITREIVESFNDPRITYIGRPENLGMALNVLSLFKQGRGKYFCVLADDDFWGPEFIARMVTALEQHPSLGMAFSDYHVVDGQGKVQPEASEAATREWGRDTLSPGLHVPGYDIGLIKRNISLVSSVFRREAVNLENFWLDTKNTYDLWLFYLALENGGGAFYDKDRLMYCRVHTGQDSANSHVPLDLNASMVYDRFLQDPRLKDLYPAFRAEIAIRRTRAGTQMLHMGQAQEARQQLLKALLAKFKPRALIGLILSFLPAKLASGFSGALRGMLGAMRRATKAG